MSWQSHEGGARWRVEPDGRITLEDGVLIISPANRRYFTTDADGCIRTRGEPTTARTLLNEYGEDIRLAAEAFDLPTSWVAAMITIEAGRIPGTLSFDPISIVDEDYRQKLAEVNLYAYRQRPHRISAGLMQTLLTTARQMYSEYGAPWKPYGVDGHIDICDLCVPERSLWLGAAYMRHQADKYGEDPVLLVGAYNAGSVKATKRNPWNIRTFGYDRIPKFAAYHNDILATLET